jgi:hypothetical protein
MHEKSYIPKKQHAREWFKPVEESTILTQLSLTVASPKGHLRREGGRVLTTHHRASQFLNSVLDSDDLRSGTARRPLAAEAMPPLSHCTTTCCQSVAAALLLELAMGVAAATTPPPPPFTLTRRRHHHPPLPSSDTTTPPPPHHAARPSTTLCHCHPPPLPRDVVTPPPLRRASHPATTAVTGLARPTRRGSCGRVPARLVARKGFRWLKHLYVVRWVVLKVVAGIMLTMTICAQPSPLANGPC